MSFDGKNHYVAIFYVLIDGKRMVKEIENFSIDFNQNELLYYNNKTEAKNILARKAIKEKYDGFYISTYEENIELNK